MFVGGYLFLWIALENKLIASLTIKTTYGQYYAQVPGHFISWYESLNAAFLYILQNQRKNFSADILCSEFALMNHMKVHSPYGWLLDCSSLFGFSFSYRAPCSRITTWFSMWENSANRKAVAAVTCREPESNIISHHKMSLVMTKIFLCHMRTTKTQISLCIRTVWSAPLLFAASIV